MKNRKLSIWAFFPSGPKLTGQELASRMILDVLRADVDLDFRVVRLPAFDRDRKLSPGHWLHFAATVLASGFRMILAAFDRGSVTYLNLGQGTKSLIVEGLPHAIASLLRPGRRSVVSLHGHFFMKWSPASMKAALLRMTLACASRVTVLGESQKEKLIEWGIPAEKIRVVDNTCEEFIEDLPEEKIPHDAVNLLYLGNLIEVKGYREYLEALLLLGGMGLNRKVNATLCGQIYKTSLDKHTNPEDLSGWTDDIIGKINRLDIIKVDWIQGAYGERKAQLFGEADIFVYPTHEDAQPIVLIEAMAAGCAVIASDVGEIPSMLAGGGGESLSDCSARSLANSIKNLVNDPQALKDKQKKARKLFKVKYSRQIYADTWREIFQELSTSADKGV